MRNDAEYQKQYRLENADKIREQKRIWRLKNKKSIKESSRKFQIKKQCIVLNRIDGYRDWQKVVFATLNRINRAKNKPNKQDKLKKDQLLLKQLRTDRENLDFAKYKTWNVKTKSKEGEKAVATDKIYRLSALISNSTDIETKNYITTKINQINDNFYSQYGERIPYYE